MTVLERRDALKRVWGALSQYVLKEEDYAMARAVKWFEALLIVGSACRAWAWTISLQGYERCKQRITGE